MIYQLDGKERIKAARLFDGVNDTTILSCLQNQPNSLVYVDDKECPSCAAAILGGVQENSGGFVFLAGDHTSPCADEIAAAWHENHKGGREIVPCSNGWIEVLGRVFPDVKSHTRYATSKTEHNFDIDKLKEAACAPESCYEIKAIDARIYEQLKTESWSCDLVCNFSDAQQYEKYAFGFACLCDGVPVGAASAYSAYDRGIEIEIDTREDHRRRGIAQANASMLIYTCLERGLYPSWDAQNKMSLSLAQSLGYVFSHEYAAFWVDNNTRPQV